VLGGPGYLVVEYVPAKPTSPLKHVIMLGAGFSNAVSDQMPTLGDLGNSIVRRLANNPAIGVLPATMQADIRKGRIPGGDLESWLTMLASPAPFVSDVETHFYAGVFAQIAKDIGDEIDAAEAEVLKGNRPAWLQHLVRLWDETGATVITFNYDTLVEHAASAGFGTEHTWPNLAFKLLKLHGSTIWWRDRDAVSVSAIREQDLLPGWSRPERDAESAGDERVLIPPIAAKGSLYDVSAIRRQWFDARLALESATHLVVIGYRLPTNDLAALALVGQHLAPKAEVVIVNREPQMPVDALNTLGRQPQVVLQGNDCISDEFVRWYEIEVARAIAPSLAAQADAVPFDDPVLGMISRPEAARAIMQVFVEDDRLVLRASDSLMHGNDRPDAITRNALMAAVNDVAKRKGYVVVRCDGADHVVLRIAGETPGGRWTVARA